MRRGLIVVADDFGLSPGVNAGVYESHTRGIVTATSLMVRHDAAKEAAEMARSLPDLDVGLHVDLGEWWSDGGEWTPVYQRVDENNAELVAEEVSEQIDVFVRLIGRPPTHLDSHQHVHERQPARSVLEQWARRLCVPLRGTGDIRYEGRFYGQTVDGSALPEAITVDALVALLHDLPVGVSEMCCHPAAAVDVDTMYRNERLTELECLCHPAVRDALVDIEHTRFSDVPSLRLERW